MLDDDEDGMSLFDIFCLALGIVDITADACFDRSDIPLGRYAH